jgi:hypothetical protein
MTNIKLTKKLLYDKLWYQIDFKSEMLEAQLDSSKTPKLWVQDDLLYHRGRK